MGYFAIPKGVDFQFSVQVFEKNSYNYRDLTNMISATFEVFDPVNLNTLLTVSMSVVGDPSKGLLTCTLEAADTEPLEPWIAPLADRAYMKSKHHARIKVIIDGEEDVSVYLDRVYIIPEGVQ